MSKTEKEEFRDTNSVGNLLKYIDEILVVGATSNGSSCTSIRRYLRKLEKESSEKVWPPPHSTAH